MFSVFSRDPQPMTFNVLRPLLRELDEFMDQQSFNHRESTNSARYLNLSCELDETDTHYVMSFDIPGVRREDLSVELDGNYLHISGERKSEGRNDLKNHGKFQKSFRLIEGVLPEAIVAEYKDGVLRVAIEKPATAKKTKINIADGTSVNRSGGFFKSLIGEKKAKEIMDAKGGRSQNESASIAN